MLEIEAFDILNGVTVHHCNVIVIETDEQPDSQLSPCRITTSSNNQTEK